MVRRGTEYYFECRKDSNGAIGVLGNFRTLYRGVEQHVTITAAIDCEGNFIIPAISNLSLGFTSMKKAYDSEADIDVFVRSNKPFFGKFGEFLLLASGTFVLNKDTGEVLDTSGLQLYMPVQVKDQFEEFVDNKGYYQPAICCMKLTYTDEHNCMKVSMTTYKAYIASLMKGVTPQIMSSKADFLKAIVFGKGGEA